jgi:nicotinate-nucleotide adenylyltransferase
MGKLGLERVVFVPVGGPYHKPDRPITPAKQRVEMVDRAISDDVRFELSLVDVSRSGPSYTVDTLSDLRDVWGEAEFFFIVGSDALLDLPNWKEPERLVKMCRFVAVPRLGWKRKRVDDLMERIDGLAGRVEILEAPMLQISSSDIRQRVKQGLSIRYLVPQEVEEYIRQNLLYTE